MTLRLSLAALATAAALAGCATTPEDDPALQQKLSDLDGRTERLERGVQNQVTQSQRVDELQAQVRELQGRIDELEHGQQNLAKQQRDLYSDLDKRLSGASAAGSAGTAGTPAGAPAGGAAGAAGAAADNAVPPDSGASSTEQAVYQQAFDSLKAGSYSLAITGFKDFLTNYPASPLAENAQYWLGESYYVNHDYDSAGSAFRAVLKKWPDSRKAPDALLKLGYTQAAQKQFPQARATLTEVVQKYPTSDAAKLAADRLKKIPAQ